MDASLKKRQEARKKGGSSKGRKRKSTGEGLTAATVDFNKLLNHSANRDPNTERFPFIEMNVQVH